MNADLFLEEYHVQIRKLVADFAKRELTDEVVKEYEENRVALRRALELLQRKELLRSFEMDTTPAHLYRKLGELGILGVAIPEAYGGSPGDTLTQVLIMEELSYAWAGFALACFAVPCSLFTYPVATYGTEEQKQKYLPGIAEGKEFGAFALTESEAGSWAANQKTTARKRDSGAWVLNGQKIFITDCTLARAIIVFARTEQGTERTSRGISAFLVERGINGVRTLYLDKWGQHAAPFGVLYLDDCEIPMENLLGKEGQGYEIAMKTLDSGRLLIAAQAIGIAQNAFDYALRYAKNRETFGKKLAEHQLIQGKLALMQVNLDASRLLTYAAAKTKDDGLPFAIEASKAKLFATEHAVAVVREAVQIVGGTAYTIECPLMRLFNEVMALPIYEGASEIQQLKIARALTKS